MIQRAKTAKDKGFGHSIDFACLEWSDIAFHDTYDLYLTSDSYCAAEKGHHSFCIVNIVRQKKVQ